MAVITVARRLVVAFGALALCLAWSTAAAPSMKKPHILHIVADDLGRNDLGYTNGKKTQTTTIDELINQGTWLDSYYTFKICSPTRASIMTGRFPFNAGFYDMNNDENHCTSNFTLLPALLKKEGYATHALGKWDIGFIKKRCTAAMSGLDSFLGYYEACIVDYWYHGAPSISNTSVFDFAESVGTTISGATGFNGTYNRNAFSDRAIEIIKNNPADTPMYMYLAFQNVHLGCGRGRKHGIQAPCETMDLYGTTKTDLFKGQGGMLTELDYGVGNVTQALKDAGMWDNTIVVFVSDNGGPLDHSTNAPFRGGKHTFWEGGVRVASFISGPVLPPSARGTIYSGMAHSSDWYVTLVEGLAGGTIPEDTGPNKPDGFNLWPAIVANATSPRHEVVHQVSNEYFTEGVTAIRVDNYKLIIGNPGDNRVVPWPELGTESVPFGQDGGEHEHGTNHCRVPPGKTHKGTKSCKPACLFDVVNDPTESHDLADQKDMQPIIANLTKRLKEYGAKGYIPAHEFTPYEWQHSAHKKMEDTADKLGFLQPIDLEQE
eukprot:m.484210 g.484210  ORF g.484210 m.484210 type:complete len:546 (+) comp23251_c0_seq1:88-1725(+)